jgi:2-keto-4-pentenoate hydratase/2-oxohepta-3-ene-1,7-dioic acid hydratase in catechol pathway
MSPDRKRAHVRIARFAHPSGMSFGVVEGEPGAGPDAMTIAEIDGHPFGQIRITTQRWALADVRLLSPILPSKVVCVGKNYAAHIAEMNTGDAPKEPLLFLKPSTSVIGPGDAIRIPPGSTNVHHEAELAVVIGRMCREVPRERVKDVILGYTCANDITARDVQKREKQWARAKGFDTACPLGPWVETDLDPSDLTIQLTVNGQQRQLGRTTEMIHSIEELIVNISEAMTLLPGDVILTGTPAGVGPLNVGDEVAVTIEGIGTLTNKVVKRG